MLTNSKLLGYSTFKQFISKKRKLPKLFKQAVSLLLVLTFIITPTTAFASQSNTAPFESFVQTVESETRHLRRDNFHRSFDFHETVTVGGSNFNIATLVNGVDAEVARIRAEFFDIPEIRNMNTSISWVMIELSDYYYVLVNRQTGRAYLYSAFASRILTVQTTQNPTILAQITNAVGYIQGITFEESNLVILYFDTIQETQNAFNRLSPYAGLFGDGSIISLAPYVHLPTSETVVMLNYRIADSFFIVQYLGFMRGSNLIYPTIEPMFISAIVKGIVAAVKIGKKVWQATKTVRTVASNVNRTVGLIRDVTATVSISASPSNGGSVSGGGHVPRYTFTTLRATPHSGEWRFDGWFQNGRLVHSDREWRFWNTSHNSTLEARFSRTTQTTTPQPPSLPAQGVPPSGGWIVGVSPPPSDSVPPSGGATQEGGWLVGVSQPQTILPSDGWFLGVHSLPSDSVLLSGGATQEGGWLVGASQPQSEPIQSSIGGGMLGDSSTSWGVLLPPQSAPAQYVNVGVYSATGQIHLFANDTWISIPVNEIYELVLQRSSSMSILAFPSHDQVFHFWEIRGNATIEDMFNPHTSITLHDSIVNIIAHFRNI